MKWKITLLVAIIAGAMGGSWIKNLPGFVIIAYDKTSYEMRLWVAVTLLLLLLSTLFLIGSFIRSLLSSASNMKGWNGQRGWRKARKQTIKGMLSFIEGRWNQSEITMVKSAKNSDTQLINYLIAAQSAQYQNATDRRDTYLRLAHKAEPRATVAIGLTQAQLQLDNDQFEQALATLNNLNTKQSNHPFILKLLCLTHQKLQDWQSIIELLPNLKKLNVFNEQQYNNIENESIQGLLKKEFIKGELESLNDVWLNLPSSNRKNLDNNLFYAKLLIQFEQMDQAFKILKPLFKKDPSKELIQLFGEVKSTLGNKQFSFLENWYTANPQAHNEIYTALGKIAFNISLWGKARFYFERSLKTTATAEAFFMMAKTLEQLNDVELASECFKQGLEFVIEPKNSQPLLTLEKGADDLVTANILPKFNH
jgi:HemY protein